MVPAAVVDKTIASLVPLLDPDGDIIIDGGNFYYIADIRRAKEFSLKEIHYVDAGASSGVWGLELGYCMMIGGETEVVENLDPIFRRLAPGPGDIPRTPGRAGHGTPGMGYLHCGPNGAGHFVKMVHNGIEYRPLDHPAAIDEGVPAHVLTAAIYERFGSRGEADSFDKLLSATRYQFGGHLETSADKQARGRMRAGPSLGRVSSPPGLAFVLVGFELVPLGRDRGRYRETWMPMDFRPGRIGRFSHLGNVVLDAGAIPAPMLLLYAHCLRGQNGGIALLAINTDSSSAHSLDICSPSQGYTLSAEHLKDSAVRLNGSELKLGPVDALPQTRNITQRWRGRAGARRHHVLSVPNANNPACKQ